MPTESDGKDCGQRIERQGQWLAKKLECGLHLKIMETAKMSG